MKIDDTDDFCTCGLRNDAIFMCFLLSLEKLLLMFVIILCYVYLTKYNIIWICREKNETTKGVFLQAIKNSTRSLHGPRAIILKHAE
jgi:hypothetical protein